MRFVTVNMRGGASAISGVFGVDVCGCGKNGAGAACASRITDLRVLTAMAAVKRERFVPKELQSDSYYDGPLPIGHGQTISQPHSSAHDSALGDRTQSDSP